MDPLRQPSHHRVSFPARVPSQTTQGARRLLPPFVILAALCSVVGCGANQRVSTSSTGAIPYFLPAVEFDIELTWLLTGCDVPNGNRVDLSVSTDITPQLVADHRHAFLIDYSELHNAFTGTDLHVELNDNGTLRSINATSTNRAADFLASIVGVATSAFRAVRWSFGPSLRPVDRCTESSLAALGLRQQLRAQITELNSRIGEITARHPLTDADKQLIQTIGQDLALKARALAGAEATLSHTQRVQWMPTASSDTIVIPLNRDALARWVLPEFIDAYEEIGLLPKVHARLCPVVGDTTTSDWTDADEHTDGRLVVYRTPRRAELTLRFDDFGGLPDEIARTWVTVPQAGSLRTLELKSQAFEDKTLVARFAQDGALTEFRYLSAARAVALSEALADAVSAVETEITASESRELQQLQNRIALLEAEANLIQAQRALNALTGGDHAD